MKDELYLPDAWLRIAQAILNPMQVETISTLSRE